MAVLKLDSLWFNKSFIGKLKSSFLSPRERLGEGDLQLFRNWSFFQRSNY